jgi:hypothetical protein
MLDGTELYVVLKLSSGEQVMAILRQEDDERILLESPMIMRTIPVFETGREHITASPLCQFSDDRTFVIHKKDVMFCKKLHHVFVPHYKKIVEENEQQSFISKDNKRSPLDFSEEMTPEIAEKCVEMLEDILEKDNGFFVDGNDTVH